MTSEDLIYIYKKKKDTLQHLDKWIEWEQENIMADIMFEYVPIKQSELDLEIAKKIALFCIIFQDYIKKEEYEKLSRYKVLFDFELERLFLFYNSNCIDWDEYVQRTALIIAAIMYNQQDKELTLNLMDNYHSIQKRILNIKEDE